MSRSSSVKHWSQPRTKKCASLTVVHGLYVNSNCHRWSLIRSAAKQDRTSRWSDQRSRRPNDVVFRRNPSQLFCTACNYNAIDEPFLRQSFFLWGAHVERRRMTQFNYDPSNYPYSWFDRLGQKREPHCHRLPRYLYLRKVVNIEDQERFPLWFF